MHINYSKLVPNYETGKCWGIFKKFHKDERLLALVTIGRKTLYRHMGIIDVGHDRLGLEKALASSWHKELPIFHELQSHPI